MTSEDFVIESLLGLDSFGRALLWVNLPESFHRSNVDYAQFVSVESFQELRQVLQELTPEIFEEIRQTINEYGENDFDL